eukprot:TRINITY_DN5072_c0_g3_i1.p1 TRINITY_DN5072_c0_g3~~TRINITY_DN5072_c0_g3_i1.p1  ORF type:complete len:329 (+),score=32.99 TRINITY_DN5072_c0_g3_i1:23-988(+)
MHCGTLHFIIFLLLCPYPIGAAAAAFGASEAAIVGSTGNTTDNNLPPSVVRCKMLQTKYFNENWKTPRFRTPEALHRLYHKFFFYHKFRQHWPNRCGSGGRTAVVDVGAGAGRDLIHWSRVFGKKAGCNHTTIYMFEPDTSYIDTLRQRATGKLFEAEDITIVNSAVSNFRGTTGFEVMHNDTGHIVLDNEGRGVKQVNVTTLNSYFRRLDVQNFPYIKIEASGFEPFVLAGASDLLARTEVLVFESHYYWRKPRGCGETLGAVVHALHQKGFLVYKVGSPYMLKMYPPFWHRTFDLHMNWHYALAVRANSPLIKFMRTLC